MLCSRFPIKFDYKTNSFLYFNCLALLVIILRIRMWGFKYFLPSKVNTFIGQRLHTFKHIQLRLILLNLFLFTSFNLLNLLFLNHSLRRYFNNFEALFNKLNHLTQSWEHFIPNSWEVSIFLHETK